MAEYNSPAIIADFAGTVDQEVEDMIDRMASLMKQTVKASASVDVPEHMQTDPIYDSLRTPFGRFALQPDIEPPVMTAQGDIDINATVRRAADHLFYAALD